MRLLTIAALSLACAFPVLAEDQTEDTENASSTVAEPGKWSGNADLGYSASNGNSETENLNALAKVEYLKGLWTHGLRLGGVREDDDGTTRAERYEVGYKVERALSEVSYVFGNLAWERDEFGGVYERTSETLGYGRKLFDTEVHRLETEIGIGARQNELRDGSMEDDAILRLAGAYERNISESATFNQDLVVETGEANTYAESISGLKLRINGNLYAKLSYTVKHNDTVPAGSEKTDTYTAVNLSYEFGKD